MRKSNYKDIEKYRKTRNAQKRRYYRKTAFSENSKKHYKAEELSMILEHKYTDSELSVLLGRSVGSIQTKRRRLKRSMELEEYNYTPSSYFKLEGLTEVMEC